MKKVIAFIAFALLVLGTVFGCTNNKPSLDTGSASDVKQTEPVKLIYEMRSKGNNSYVEFDLVAGTVTIYNTISGKKGTEHIAPFSGTYPNTIEAYFEDLEATKTFTFDDNKLFENDSRGYSHTFKLYSQK